MGRHREQARQARSEGKQQRAEERAAAEALGAVPPTVTVGFALGMSAQRGQHPEIADELLDLQFIVPNGKIILRLPVAAWDDIEDEAHRAIAAAGAAADPDAETARRAEKAGVHLPVGVDLREEAAAHQAIRAEEA